MESTATHDGHYLRSGALAGAAAALAFTAFHQLVISNIWFSLPIMMIAGALCGLCVGWSYEKLYRTPSSGGWVRYNLVYVAMFVLMSGVSVIIYEPITTMAAVIDGGSPNELYREAWLMTVLFTIGAAIGINLMFGRRRSTYLPVFVTCIVLVVTLGLNVSIIGLVDIPISGAYLVAEFLGLILFLDVAFVAVFVLLERDQLAPSLLPGVRLFGRPRVP